MAEAHLLPVARRLLENPGHVLEQLKPTVERSARHQVEGDVRPDAQRTADS